MLRQEEADSPAQIPPSETKSGYCEIGIDQKIADISYVQSQDPKMPLVFGFVENPSQSPIRGSRSSGAASK
jgi:hypothetical protein